MVELRDEEDGRVALIMDKKELSFAVEVLMRAGYGLTRPSGAEAEESEEGAEEPETEPEEEPEEPEAEAEEPEQAEEEPEGPEAESQEPAEEPEEEEPEELQAEAEEEPEGRSIVRRRGSRAHRLWAGVTALSRTWRSRSTKEGERANG